MYHYQAVMLTFS